MKRVRSQSVYLKALYNEHRIKLIYLLHRKKTMDTHQIIKELEISKGAVSQHLQRLTTLGILDCERSGLGTKYTLIDDRAIEILKMIEK